MPAYSTVQPLFCAPAAFTTGPPALTLRTSAFFTVQGTAPPSSAGLNAFAALQLVLSAAAPLQTRHVPTIRLVPAPATPVSSSTGGCSSATSPPTCAEPTVGVPVKSPAAQAGPFEHSARLTPAPVPANQSCGAAGSISGNPPSPLATCGHAVAVSAPLVAAVPFTPSP